LVFSATLLLADDDAILRIGQRQENNNQGFTQKGKKADGAFGAPGSTAVHGALRAILTVRGISLGAFGEFSESINVLIQGLAHEGALKNPGKFGQSNYKAVYGQIHWWLKRRWARLAVITAVEARYAGLGYAGGSAQQ
jgi:hypothetical protein